MANFEEKAGVNMHMAGEHQWCQTVDEVTVFIEVDDHVRSRNINLSIKPKHLSVTINNHSVLDGELSGSVKPNESTWTIEDNDKKTSPNSKNRIVRIVLIKSIQEESWKSVIKGEHELSISQVEEDNKKLLLERFQGEHPGFDFSGANFSGQVPSDTKNFMRFD